MKQAIDMMYLKTTLTLMLALFINNSAYASIQSQPQAQSQTQSSLRVEALYSASPTNDPTTIIANHASRRMVLKVVDRSDDIWHSPKQHSHWLSHLIAQETKAETLAQVMFITGVLDSILSKEDEVTIDYIQPHGSQIRINGVTVLSSQSMLLFEHFFNNWLDYSPHSSAKHHSKAAEQKLTSMNNKLFNYNTSQSQLVNSWMNARKSAKASLHTQLALSTPKKVIAVTQPKDLANEKMININERLSSLEKRRLAMEEKRLAAEEKRLAAAERRLAAAEQRLAAEEKRLAAEEKKLLARETSKTLAATHTSNPFSHGGSQQQVELKKLQPSKNKQVVKKQKKLESVVSTTKNEAFIKLENQYYLDLYKFELKTEIYRSVTYPDWAKSLGKTGKVQLNFSVDRNTRVTKVHGHNPDISIQLISELHRAIIAAAKLVLPPDALPGNSWDMSISYDFQPGNIQQAALEKPTKPLFLEREDSTVLISAENNLTTYQENIKDIITDRIEYPVWAEKLNQQGKVAFEIVINQDGSIGEVIPKEVNRHIFLNQEVLNAINESAPLPSIPEHLRLQSTNMIIQHDFKKNKH